MSSRLPISRFNPLRFLDDGLQQIFYAPHRASGTVLQQAGGRSRDPGQGVRKSCDRELKSAVRSRSASISTWLCWVCRSSVINVPGQARVGPRTPPAVAAERGLLKAPGIRGHDAQDPTRCAAGSAKADTGPRGGEIIGAEASQTGSR